MFFLYCTLLYVLAVITAALEATADTDSDTFADKSASLCGLTAMTTSGIGPLKSSSNKDNVSTLSLPDLEFGTVQLGNISKQSSAKSVFQDSDSSHSFREFDQMCSRTIGGSVGSFRTPKDDRDRSPSYLSVEAEEFLNMLPDYRFLLS